MRNVALGIFAHPDDAEFMCAGTLSLLRKAGWAINIASMTAGDKGSNELSRNEISNIRRSEAVKSAELLEGKYHCLEFDDVYILYNRESINRTTKLIREIHPGIVFTASPNDYMFDHEITSHIVQTACFSTGIKNLEINEEPFEPIPYLYYCDSMEGKDIFGKLIEPSICVDISGEIDVKERMLASHESQRNWILYHHKVDEYILFMKRMAEIRGKYIDSKYAEGFRQHLGHGYPSDNKLQEVLGPLVKCIPFLHAEVSNI